MIDQDLGISKKADFFHVVGPLRNGHFRQFPKSHFMVHFVLQELCVHRFDYVSYFIVSQCFLDNSGHRISKMALKNSLGQRKLTV